MLLDDLFKNLSRVAYQTRDFVTGGNETPLMNIYEKESDYSVRVLLPGVSKEDVSITYADGFLTVEGEKKEVKTDTAENIRSEIGYGKFARAIRLSDKIDSGSIAAKFENGVLVISMKTAPEKAPKKIAIG